MTVNITEIVSLVQCFKSYMDNSNDTLWSLRISDHGAGIHMQKKEFLSKFIQYEINVNENSDSYPYELTSCIDEVSFFALFNTAEIIELKDTMPNQWEYIQNEIQKETA